MNCALCGNTNFNVITNKLRNNIQRKVVQCLNCSLIFLENPTADVIDYSGSEYRAMHSPVLGKVVSPEEMLAIQMPFQKARIDRIRQLLNPDSCVLEIGCSTGHFLHAIKDFVSERIGIELDPNHADFARKHCQLEIYERPLEKTKLPFNHFDIIFMFQVFEHIPNPLQFLLSCKKYLKPSGTIYLEVPNVNDALLSVYNITSYRNFYFRAPHVYYYSEQTLQKILRKAGYVGTIRTVQEYSVFNHMHWLLTGKPQASQKDGQGPLQWKCPDSSRKEDEITLRYWFDKINEEYRNLLEKMGIADIICYEGKLDFSLEQG